MRQTRWILPLLALFLLGCAGEAEIGRRYRAERALWTVNKAWEELAIRPELIGDEERLAVAAQFEEIANRFGSVPATEDTSAAGRAVRETRAIAARAKLSAAQMVATQGDLERADRLYAEMEQEFTDLPGMAGDASLNRAILAETDGRREDAIAAFQRVVDTVKPHLGVRGSVGSVMQLPLRLARLRAEAAPDTSVASRAPYYRDAEAYYEGIITESPGTALAIEARSRLVDVATDLRRWNDAVDELRALDAEAREVGPDAGDPGEVRFALAEAQFMIGQADSSRKTLQSLLRDDPKSAFAPRALITLSMRAYGEGRIDDALALLDRVVSEYSGDEDNVASALLQKARILDRSDRWVDALDIYRTLPREHPVTEPALLAPLEIAAHYGRVGDAAARDQALAAAEAGYRQALERYPSDVFAASIRAKLTEIFLSQKRYREAMVELVQLAQSQRGTRQGVVALIKAADLAYTQLDDKEQAIQILDRGAQWYEGSDFGERLQAQATKLREESTP